MRGLYSIKTKIAMQIFTEIARMAYEGNDTSTLEELPYRIVPAKLPCTATIFFWNAP